MRIDESQCDECNHAWKKRVEKGCGKNAQTATPSRYEPLPLPIWSFEAILSESLDRSIAISMSR